MFYIRGDKVSLVNPYIHSIAYYLPEKKLANEELALEITGWSANKIYTKTGIKARHIAGENEFASDLAEKAALNLFRENDIKPEDVDFMIVCTQSSDYFLPPIACVLQEKLNIPKSCGAIDINMGCSGYVYALALAKSMIIAESAKNVLLITTDTYTKYINPQDKSTRTLFGDGASATYITGDSTEKRIGQFVLGTDGKGAKNLIVEAGGLRCPKSDETKIEIKDKYGNVRSPENLYMNGPEIYNFAIREVPGLVSNVLSKNNLSKDDIDLFVFHQSNRYMLENLRKEIDVPEEKFYINMEEVGNTVSTTIPLALNMASKDGVLKRGDRVMLVGFGVGYSWGGTVIVW